MNLVIVSVPGTDSDPDKRTHIPVSVLWKVVCWESITFTVVVPSMQSKCGIVSFHTLELQGNFILLCPL